MYLNKVQTNLPPQNLIEKKIVLRFDKLLDQYLLESFVPILHDFYKFHKCSFQCPNE